MTAGGGRLDRSRLAILEHVHRKEQRRHGGPAYEEAPEMQSDEGTWKAHRRQHKAGPGGWLETVRDVFSDWWRYHPAHMAVDVARPMLSSYARRKPVQYLGAAAVLGAGVFLLRPWKLISVTGVAVALLKSPQVAALIMRAMAASQDPRDEEPLRD